MQSFTIDEYTKAGCKEMTVPEMVVVHGLTGGRVCDTGCWAFDGGRCPAYQRLKNAPKAVANMAHATETVREEAQRRGVSIKQVRRERRDA